MMGSSIQRVAAVATVALLAGCGGGGGGGGATDLQRDGVFLDSAVEGVRYETPSLDPTLTDQNGTFEYILGQDVEFYIGEIFLGRAPGASVLTPIDLVPLANDEEHPTVTNLIRFIQTLDQDLDPDNGILIEQQVRDLANDGNLDLDLLAFDVPTSNFVTNSMFAVSYLTQPYGSRPLVLTGIARAHLKSTLVEIDDPNAPPPCQGDCGSLAVTDPGMTVEDPFAPDPGLSFSTQISTGFSRIQWYQPGLNETTVTELQVDHSNGEPRVIALTWESQSGAIQNYGVSCPPGFDPFPMVPCNGITIDTQARTVDFSTIVLESIIDSSTITLNGLLEYP